MKYPTLNQSIKWRFDCIISFKTTNKKSKKMNALQDRFYEDIERAVKKNFEEYFMKLSELQSSYFALIKRQRVTILGMKTKDFI